MFTRETCNVKRKIERKFSKSRPKLGKFWWFWGSGGQGLQKVAIFTPKGTCSWIYVVWAILRQNRSRGVTYRSVGEKNPESHRGSHKKDMSPLTQGLNYRSACDYHKISGHHPMVERAESWKMAIQRCVTAVDLMPLMFYFFCDQNSVKTHLN